MDRLEEHLRLIAQALRSGDSDAARDADRRWEAQGPPNGPLTYTPGLARQLAELGRLSDEQGSEAAVRFVAALGRLTAPAYASPQMRLRMARDATVAKPLLKLLLAPAATPTLYTTIPMATAQLMDELHAARALLDLSSPASLVDALADAALVALSDRLGCSLVEAAAHPDEPGFAYDAASYIHLIHKTADAAGAPAARRLAERVDLLDAAARCVESAAVAPAAAAAGAGCCFCGAGATHRVLCAVVRMVDLLLRCGGRGAFVEELLLNRGTMLDLSDSARSVGAAAVRRLLERRPGFLGAAASLLDAHAAGAARGDDECYSVVSYVVVFLPFLFGICPEGAEEGLKLEQLRRGLLACVKGCERDEAMMAAACMAWICQYAPGACRAPSPGGETFRLVAVAGARGACALLSAALARAGVTQDGSSQAWQILLVALFETLDELGNREGPRAAADALDAAEAAATPGLLAMLAGVLERAPAEAARAAREAQRRPQAVADMERATTFMAVPLLGNICKAAARGPGDRSDRLLQWIAGTPAFTRAMDAVLSPSIVGARRPPVLLCTSAVTAAICMASGGAQCSRALAAALRGGRRGLEIIAGAGGPAAAAATRGRPSPWSEGVVAAATGTLQVLEVIGQQAVASGAAAPPSAATAPPAAARAARGAAAAAAPASRPAAEPAGPSQAGSSAAARSGGEGPSSSWGTGSTPASPARTCVVCGASEAPGGQRLLKCSACLKPGLRYCGAECQRAHWKAGHKQECQQLQQQAVTASAASSGSV